MTPKVYLESDCDHGNETEWCGECGAERVSLLLIPVETVEAQFDGTPQPHGSNWPEPGRYLLIRQENNDG